MLDVTWEVTSIAGILAGEPARLVQVRAFRDSPEFPDRAAIHAFEVWVPASITDLGAITRAAYERLHMELSALLVTVPSELATA